MDLATLQAEVSVGPVRPLQTRKIVKELEAFQREVAEKSGASASLRLTTMNLVVGCSTPEDAVGLGAELAELTADFPSRCLVAVLDPAAADGELQGWASHACHPFRRGQVCCEQVALYCPGTGGGSVPSLVLATLHPDLPTLLWWRGEPPFGSDLLEQMVEPTNRVVWDSRRFPDGSLLPQTLEFLQDRYHQEQAFSDLAWGGIELWREEVASLFDSPDAAPALDDLESVEIDFRPGRGEVAPQPLLLAGWMASRLGWHTARLHGAADGMSASLGGRRPVTLKLIPRPERADVPQGQIAEFRCSGPGGSHRVEGVRPRRRAHREVRPGVTLDEARRLEVDLMGHELAVLSRDPIYQEALEAAVDLLPAREVARA